MFASNAKTSVATVSSVTWFDSSVTSFQLQIQQQKETLTHCDILLEYIFCFEDSLASSRILNIQDEHSLLSDRLYVVHFYPFSSLKPESTYFLHLSVPQKYHISAVRRLQTSVCQPDVGGNSIFPNFSTCIGGLETITWFYSPHHSLGSQPPPPSPRTPTPLINLS